MSCSIEPAIGMPADFVVFQNKSRSGSFRSIKTIHEAVYDGGNDRITIFNGQVVNR
jgi:hypothetical protein